MYTNILKKLRIGLIIIFVSVGALISFSSCDYNDNAQNSLHVHEYNTLKFDTETHWYECSCQKRSNIEIHQGGIATENTKAICEVCNFEYGLVLEHVHNYVCQVIEDKYLKTPAKCESKAEYFYSCTCGEKSVEYFEFGDTLNHSYGKWISNGNNTHVCICSNDSSHFIIEDCKGGIATENTKAICEVCNESYGEVLFYKREGNYIYFGKFPQTIKEDNVSILDKPNKNGYYVGSDGEEYAKLVATPYPYKNYCFSNGYSISKGVVYYFKVEKIRWRILEEKNGVVFLLCDNIISNSRFDNVSNNYGYSEIRSWLNNDFLSLAFTKQEQEIIQTNFVLNSNHYNVSNHNIKYLDVEDKIFLLSEEELNNDTYELTSDNSRKILTTDYSRAKGAWNLMKNWYDEPYGSWWLRCPYAQATDYIRIVTYNDFKQLSIYNEKITSTQHGIVPALKIKI